MIIDMRYHVASLVAVFLALGLGIVIGASLGKTINLRFDQQIQHLEQTYQKIREDQKLLRASLQSKDNELDIANQFQKAIIPSLITHRLIGKRIAVIRTNNSVEFKYARDLVNLLREAGAEVTSITSFTKIFNFTDPQLKSDLSNAFSFPNTTSDQDLVAKIDLKLLEILAQGQGGGQLFYLQNKDLVQLWGDYNRGYVDTIIFLGGGLTAESNHQKEIDLPLLEAARKTGAVLIGVEPSFVPESYMRLYQSKCQGTVDNIETSPGEVTLVYLLSSGKRGFYGTKDTARSLTPAFKLDY